MKEACAAIDEPGRLGAEAGAAVEPLSKLPLIEGPQHPVERVRRY